MIFTEQEIKRLEELAEWGIKKGIQDPDLKNAKYKLQKMLKYESDLKMHLEDSENPVAAENKYVLERTVTMLEKLLGRAINREEGKTISDFVRRGWTYEQIRFGIGQSVSELGVLDWEYVKKILEKELSA